MVKVLWGSHCKKKNIWKLFHYVKNDRWLSSDISWSHGPCLRSNSTGLIQTRLYELIAWWTEAEILPVNLFYEIFAVHNTWRYAFFQICSQNYANDSGIGCMTSTWSPGSNELFIRWCKLWNAASGHCRRATIFTLIRRPLDGKEDYSVWRSSISARWGPSTQMFIQQRSWKARCDYTRLSNIQIMLDMN